MNREAAVLTLALLGATLVTAACDRKPSEPPPAPGSTSSTAQPPASSAAKEERKESHPPAQGQVDPKEPAQQKDFETKK